LQVDFSGGLRREEDLNAAILAGASQIVVGSAAVKERLECERWFEHFGPERIILGVDVLNGFVRVNGWQESAELSLSTVVDWYVPAGLKTLMSTDIGRDGMLAGPSFSLYAKLTQRYPELRLIASGGVSSSGDVRKLSRQGVAEVIVGKALYTGALVREEVMEFVW
jgi:phosphoribosylformimino-5-aminoimidazole carboxamide ribotide isomerase